jgi:hypothetical protein
MSLGGKGSVGCLSRSLPPAGHTPVAMLRQGSPREIKKRGFNRERDAPQQAPRTAKNHYIRSMIAFSVGLGRIAATHLSSSGK